MRRLIACLLAALASPAPAHATSPATRLVAEMHTPAAYLGIVTTRNLGSEAQQNFSQANFQAIGYARVKFCYPQILVSNVLTLSNNDTETGSNAASAVTVTASLKNGTTGGPFVQVKAGGSASFSLAAAVYTVSDPVPICFNPGDQVIEREFWSTPGKVIGNANLCTGQSEGGELAASGLTDKTLGGTIANTSTIVHHPAAIIAYTKAPSVVITGSDSISWGQNDVMSDANCDTGIIARSIGPTIAYSNFGVPGGTIQNYITSSTQRKTIGLTYASHIVLEDGTNDIHGGRTAAQVEADRKTAATRFGGKPVLELTITPQATSASSYTANDQVGKVNFTPLGTSARETLNDDIRTNNPGLTGQAGFFDPSLIAEGSATQDVHVQDSGMWMWDPGTSCQWVSCTDGVHPAQYGYLQVVSNHIIDLAKLRR